LIFTSGKFANWISVDVTYAIIGFLPMKIVSRFPDDRDSWEDVFWFPDDRDSWEDVFWFPDDWDSGVDVFWFPDDWDSGVDVFSVDMQVYLSEDNLNLRMKKWYKICFFWSKLENLKNRDDIIESTYWSNF